MLIQNPQATPRETKSPRPYTSRNQFRKTLIQNPPGHVNNPNLWTLTQHSPRYTSRNQFPQTLIQNPPGLVNDPNPWTFIQKSPMQHLAKPKNPQTLIQNPPSLANNPNPFALSRNQFPQTLIQNPPGIVNNLKSLDVDPKFPTSWMPGRTDGYPNLSNAIFNAGWRAWVHKWMRHSNIVGPWV